MAQGDVIYKSLGVTLKGVPPELLPEDKDAQLRAWATAVQQNAGPGTYSWPEVRSIAQQGQPLSGDAEPPKEAPPVNRPTDLKSMKGAGPTMGVAPPEDKLSKKVADWAEGSAGGVVYDKGRTAALTAAGAAAGTVVPGLGNVVGAGLGFLTGELVLPIVDAGIEIANKVFDKDFKTTQEGWYELFKKAGVEEPETSAERLTAAGVGAAIDAKTMLSLAKGLLYAENKLGGDVLNNITSNMVAAPAQEYAGTGGAYLGAAGAQELINKSGQGLPEPLKAALPIAAGAAGAAAGSGTFKPIGERQRVADVPIPARAQDAIKTGEQYNVPVTGPAVAANENFRLKEIQQQGAQFKGGTQQMHQDINKARSRMVTNIGQEFEVEIDGLGGANTPYTRIAQEVIDNHKDVAYTYGKAKKDIIEQASGRPLGEDYNIWVADDGAVVRVSLDEFDPTAYTSSPTTPQNLVKNVDVSGTTKKIDNYINRYTPDREVIPDQYRRMFDNLTRWEQELEGADLVKMEDLRKDISSYWTNPDKKEALGDIELQAYNKIYKSIATDMGKGIKEQLGTAKYNEWMVANKRLSNLMNDYEIKALSTALEEGGTSPQKVVQLFWDKEPERIKDIVEEIGWSEDGKKLAEQALQAHLIEQSLLEDGTVSGNAYGANLGRYRESIPIVYGEAGKRRFEGIKALLGTTAFSEIVDKGRLQERTPGMQEIAPGAGMALSPAFKIAPGTAIAASKGFMGIKGAILKHYHKPEIRDFLVKLSYAKPGSDKLEKLAQNFFRTLRGYEEPVDEVGLANKSISQGNWQNTTGIPGAE
jgi:hypothetical protein